MTVSIPYRNNPIDLGVLLVQLQQQKLKPKAVYIADNSADGSGFAIAKRYHFDMSIPFAIQRNVGNIHKSWNEGIKFALEDDVCLLNDDVMIPWDFIEVFDAFAKSGGASVYCPANDGFPPTQTTRKGYEWYSTSEISNYVLSKQEYILPPSIRGWCMVIPHKTIEEVGLFDEEFKLYFGDKDYEARIFNKGGKIAFINGVFVQHYGSSSTFRLEEKKINKFYEHDEALYKKKYGIKEANGKNM